MRPVRLSHRSPQGFSLIELTVVASIVAVLTGLVVGAAHNARGVAADTACLSNLRQVSVALRLYMMNHHLLPSDYPRADLQRDLGPFLQHPGVLACPLDHKTPGRSYDPFYVARRDDDAAYFVIGCPRHDGNRAAINLLAESSVQRFDLADVLFVRDDPPDLDGNGSAGPNTPDGARPVRPGDAVSAGQLRFEDGSRLTVFGDGKVVLLQSFRKASGVLYTVVRIVAGSEAQVDVQVTPGSQFEVITPAAIAGVRGTKFTVQVIEDPSESSTCVAVREGIVWVAPTDPDLGTQSKVDVSAGERVTFTSR